MKEFLMHRFIALAIYSFLLCAQAALVCLGVAMPLHAQNINDQSQQYQSNVSLSPITSDHYHAPVLTRIYTIAKGDTAEIIAKRYNLSVEGLATLNQSRFFIHGFNSLKAGDIIYVPVAPVSMEMANFIATGESPETTIRNLVPILENYIENGGKTSNLYSITKNYLTNKANMAVGQFLNQYGTARVQLNLDEDFSLKDSEFEMLLPLYDQGKHLVFTQAAFHRTDERNQMNLGLGYRYFANDYMIGGNAFMDYDLSRAHARMGIGGEYWRDYLKLSANGYLRLTDWQISPDVEDYLERPASGFDIRAEAFLPNYPQLGMNVNFEQYFGDEVALFGKDNRQKNPFAVTLGASYTPIPLVTFNADYRQGEDSNADARFGFQVNYRFGVDLKEQLDPNNVDNMRSLKGQRYDLVERNNNIILEYKKQQLVFLYMIDRIAGAYNETYSLGISLKSKYALANLLVFGNDFLAAGGKIIKGSGFMDYSITLPHYVFGGNNTYTIEAEASDVEGNQSNRAKAIVTVNMPALDLNNSKFEPLDSALPADNKSTIDLKLTLMSSEATPYDIPAEEIQYSITGLNNAKIAKNFKRIAAGVYTITVTAGTALESLNITPIVNGFNVNSATVNIVPGLENASVLEVKLVGTITSKAADGSNYFEFQAIVKDRETGNPVPYAVVEWRQNKGNAVILVDSASGSPATTSTSDKDGIATIYVKSTTAAASNIEISANVVNDINVGKGELVNFVGNAADANLSFVLQNPETTEKIADGVNYFSYLATVSDANGNPVPNVAISLGKTPDNDARLSSTLITTNTNGQATVTLQSTTKAVYDIVVNATTSSPNASVDAIEVSFKAGAPAVDGTTLSTFIINPESIVANGVATASITFTAKDVNGNPIRNLAPNLNFNFTPQTSAIAVSDIQETSEGVYTATVKGTLAQLYTGVPQLNGSAIAGLSDTVTLTADPATAALTIVLQDSTNIKTANGTNNFTYLATLVDANGNPFANITINLSKNPNVSANFATTSVITNASGQATIQLNSTTTTVGNIVVTGTTTNPNATANADQAVTFNNTTYIELAWNSDADTTVNGNTANTNVTAQPIFNVVVKDVNSNAIANANVSFTLSSDKGGKPNIFPTSVTSDANGAVAQEPAVSDRTQEKVTITATLISVNGQAFNSPVPVTAQLIANFSAGPVNAGTSTISASEPVITADGQSTTTIIFTPRDTYGNEITNVDPSTISSNIVGIDNSGITLSSWKFVNGHYEAIMTAGTKTGDVKVIPSINGTQAISSSTPTIVKLAPGEPTATQGSIAAISNQIVADGSTSATLYFKPKDQYGNFITGLAPSTISQNITSNEGANAGVKVGAWSYDTATQSYIATLTAGTTIGNLNIMPTINGEDSANTGINNTLALVPENSSGGTTSTLNIATTIATNSAIADGVASKALTVTVTDSSGASVAGKQVTITPQNNELQINGAKQAQIVTLDATGSFTTPLASTYASWLGVNAFNIQVGGYSSNQAVSFDLYVDQAQSTFSLNKNVMYNNGEDSITATFQPVDKLQRAIPTNLLNVSFTSTDTNDNATITPNGFTATLKSQSSPSYYYLSLTMNNYSAWQPQSLQYELQPVSGVLLATLEVAPKLCATKQKSIGTGIYIYTECTPNQTASYYHSGLGFVITVKNAGNLWNKQIKLQSSTVDGEILLYAKDSTTKYQNCSAPVTQSGSWMNDYGGPSQDYTLNLDFTNNSNNQIDTYQSYGFHSKNGGIGSCEVSGLPIVNPQLVGSGNVQFVASTTTPPSENSFKVPLTNERIDAGTLAAITVKIYSSQ